MLAEFTPIEPNDLLLGTLAIRQTRFASPPPKSIVKETGRRVRRRTEADHPGVVTEVIACNVLQLELC
jgi:hypothetical protein